MIMNINISIFMLLIHRTINTYLNGVSRLVSLGIIVYVICFPMYCVLWGGSVAGQRTDWRGRISISEKFAYVLQSTKQPS
jgi:hypothetical protein